MGYTRRLLIGIAEHLAAAGVGEWLPETVATEPDGVAITVGWLPDRGSYVVLDATPLSTDTATDTTTYAVRVRVRSAVTDDGGTATDDLADAVFDALHGMWSHRLATGVSVQAATRSGTGSVTADAAGRTTRVEPYAVTTERPVPNHAEIRE